MAPGALRISGADVVLAIVTHNERPLLRTVTGGARHNRLEVTAIQAAPSCRFVFPGSRVDWYVGYWHQAPPSASPSKISSNSSAALTSAQATKPTMATSVTTMAIFIIQTPKSLAKSDFFGPMPCGLAFAVPSIIEIIECFGFLAFITRLARAFLSFFVSGGGRAASFPPPAL